MSDREALSRFIAQTEETVNDVRRRLSAGIGRLSNRLFELEKKHGRRLADLERREARQSAALNRYILRLSELEGRVELLDDDNEPVSGNGAASESRVLLAIGGPHNGKLASVVWGASGYQFSHPQEEYTVRTIRLPGAWTVALVYARDLWVVR